MELKKVGVSGTLESSDVMITLEPGNGGIEIELSSTVEKQFGNAIRREILATLESMGVNNARVTAVDKGALDCVIRARVKTAVCRAAEVEYNWGGDGQ
ncbi:MAG TPA: citrate lyase acyl carrier protein [Clostridiales bacterium]|jgi:citrate lyase subunit gamma (acyl carrier protein)|nr:citrate lyase acyl carrier protein [Clostridiales bacterium]